MKRRQSDFTRVCSPPPLAQAEGWGATLLQWGAFTGSAPLAVEGDAGLEWTQNLDVQDPYMCVLNGMGLGR